MGGVAVFLGPQRAPVSCPIRGRFMFSACSVHINSFILNAQQLRPRKKLSPFYPKPAKGSVGSNSDPLQYNNNGIDFASTSLFNYYYNYSFIYLFIINIIFYSPPSHFSFPAIMRILADVRSPIAAMPPAPGAGTSGPRPQNPRTANRNTPRRGLNPIWRYILSGYV